MSVDRQCDDLAARGKTDRQRFTHRVSPSPDSHIRDAIAHILADFMLKDLSEHPPKIKS